MLGTELSTSPAEQGRALLGWSRRYALLLASLAVILLATLLPDWGAETSRRPPGQEAGIADMLLNMALFAPLGAALALQGRTAPRSLLFGVLLSTAIEIAQLWVPGRVTSARDVVANTLGTLVGWVVIRSAPMWLRPPARMANRLALAAAAMACGVIALTGFLLSPAFPPTQYFGGWMHKYGTFAAYRGKVLAASIGDLEVPEGPLQNSQEVRNRLLLGEPIRFHAVAGPNVARLAPLLSIHDRTHEILLIGADRDDLVYRFRTRGAALGFDSPEIRVRGVLGNLHAGEPLAIEVTPQRQGYCITVNAVSRCGLGFTAGTGWALLLAAQEPPPWADGLLSSLWVAALTVAVSYWAGSWSTRVVGVVILAAALVLVPPMTGLVATPVGQMAVALAGLLAPIRK